MMLLDDLKTGHIIRYRNGNLRMTLRGAENGDFFVGQGSYARFEDYNDDLKNINVESLDIIEVYKPNGILPTIENISARVMSIDNKDRYKLIWKRIE